MKFCYNTNFTLPKQFKRSRSILQDGSRSLGLFWKEITLSYTDEIPYQVLRQLVYWFGRRSFLKVFTWLPCWSCNLDHLSPVLFLLAVEVVAEIWLQSTSSLRGKVV